MAWTNRNHSRGVVAAAAIAAALVLASSVAGAAAAVSTPAGSRTAAAPQTSAAPQVVVKDPANRFTITVPANWAVQTSTSSRAPAVTAKSPAANGQLPDSVDVITQDLPSPINAKQCADKISVVMRFTIHQWTTLREGPGTFQGMPAYVRDYTWRTGAGQNRRSDLACVTLGRRAFVLIGTTANDQRSVQQDLPQLQHIMATFQPNLKNIPQGGTPSAEH